MKYIILSWLFFVGVNSFSQNIFDYQNSIKYAKYLTEHKDYERLLTVLNSLEIQQPDSINIKIWKVKCYLNLGQPIPAYNYISTINSGSNYKNELDFLKLKTAILLDRFTNYSTDYFDLNNQAITELLCYNCFYLYGIDSAISFTKQLVIDKKKQQFILDLLTQAKASYKHKKPWLASVFSIVPGLGQIYSKQFSDAYLGVIPVYLNGTIAALSFAKYGTQSVFGWVNLGMAAGFYLGNIYGAYQSAKRINILNYKKTNNEIKKHIATLEY